MTQESWKALRSDKEILALPETYSLALIIHYIAVAITNLAPAYRNKYLQAQ